MIKGVSEAGDHEEVTAQVICPNKEAQQLSDIFSPNHFVKLIDVTGLAGAADIADTDVGHGEKHDEDDSNFKDAGNRAPVGEVLHDLLPTSKARTN